MCDPRSVNVSSANSATAKSASNPTKCLICVKCAPRQSHLSSVCCANVLSANSATATLASNMNSSTSACDSFSWYSSTSAGAWASELRMNLTAGEASVSEPDRRREEKVNTEPQEEGRREEGREGEKRTFFVALGAKHFGNTIQNDDGSTELVIGFAETPPENNETSR